MALKPKDTQKIPPIPPAPAAAPVPEPMDVSLILFPKGREPIRFVVTHSIAVMVMRTKVYQANPEFQDQAAPEGPVPQTVVFDHTGGTQLIELDDITLAGMSRIVSSAEQQLTPKIDVPHPAPPQVN